MTETPNVQQVPLQLQLDEETAQGMYINMATISHNDTEFILDLIYLQPQQPKGKVRARVITSPKHMKRLLHVLQGSLRSYEQRFGTIDLGGGTDFPVH